MDTKLCNKCGKVKPISEFGKNKTKKDGLQSQCKECVKIYKKQHYENNKQYYIDKAKTYKEKCREELNSYKSKLICANCGESRWWLLDFHHIDPSEKEGEISKLFNSPNKLKRELDKCIVLCSNCHRDLHFKFEHNCG